MEPTLSFMALVLFGLVTLSWWFGLVLFGLGFVRWAGLVWFGCVGGYGLVVFSFPRGCVP